MNKLLSKSGISHKLDSIKKTMQSSLNKIKFEQILDNLESVNEVRFIKARIELHEKHVERGFIDKDHSQYFEIKTKGLASPLLIVLEVLKGNIEAFLSFTNAEPNKDWHDRKFRGTNLELHSKSNLFNENKCYIAVHAKTNSSIEIQFMQNRPVIELKNPRFQSKSMSKSHDFSKEINEIRESMELKQSFDLKVQEIKTKRKFNQRLNFISMNKTSASLSVNVHSFTQPSKLTQKIEDVKRRKVLISEEKTKRLRQNLMRRELKKQAEDQANEIHEMMMKKERMQQKWFNLVYFSISFMNWASRLRSHKEAKISNQILRMKAYTIQKNFKLRFDPKFSFNYRTLALARNNLTMYGAVLVGCEIRKFVNNLQKCVKEIRKYQKVEKSFDKFSESWTLIKARWKFFVYRNHRRANQLLALWNKTASGMISKLNVKGKKKKKTHIIDKIASIPHHVKEKFVKDHMNNCKSKFLTEIRKGYKPSSINYSIEEEKLSKIILQHALPKPKLQKKQTLIKNP